MARLTKEILKSLMRECIEEIFEEKNLVLMKEGARAAPVAPAPAARPTAQPEAPAERPARRENPMLVENINRLASSLAITSPDKQSLYADIFADTAANTLQEQVEPGKGNVQAIEVTPEVMEKEVEQLEHLSIDGDIGRWAAVAFQGQSKK